MIEPFNRHFFGLQLPVLVLVLRAARQATFRSFRELPSDVEHVNPVTAGEAKRLVAAHAAPWPSILYPRRAIPGRLLDKRLKGRVYEELGGVCLDLDGCSFSIALHPDHGLIGNLDPGIEVTYEDVLAGAQNPFPGINLAADTLDLAPESYATVTASLVTSSGEAILDAEAEIYLEHTGGYLPKLRVATEGGSARFRIGALGLEAGDAFRVKAGFRHYSGVAELAFRVI